MVKYTFEKPRTLLQYPINEKLFIYSCYIIPTCLNCLVYILHFTADSVLSYQHYRAGDPFYASLTLFFIYTPAIGSFFLTITNLELWPEETGCKSRSFKWFSIRFFQHLLFPIWAMLRYLILQ